MNVPSLTHSAANNDGGYGDQLLFEMSADQPSRVCVSDKLIPYPSGSDCTMYLSTNGETKVSQKLSFTNYMNRRPTGQI